MLPPTRNALRSITAATGYLRRRWCEVRASKVNQACEGESPAYICVSLDTVAFGGWMRTVRTASMVCEVAPDVSGSTSSLTSPTFMPLMSPVSAAR